MDDPATLERRVAAGDWLRTGEVAVLLGVSRGTVHNWVKIGAVGYRTKGIGKQRVCDPADVRRLLDRNRQVRRGDTPPADA